jgi:hypothetical protein
MNIWRDLMLPNTFRAFGGWSSIISGILLFIAHFINFIGGVKEGTLTGSTIVLIAHVLVIFGLIGIYVEHANEAKLLGMLAMIVSVLGTTFVSGIVFVEMAGFSGVNTDLVFNATVSSVIYTTGPLLFVAGMLLLGVAIIKAKKLPKAGGIFLLLGTVIFALASILVSEKLLIEVLGAAFTGLGFVWSGFPMIHSEHYRGYSTTKEL